MTKLEIKNPYYNYYSDHRITWMEASITLGRLAARGNEKAVQEILDAVSQYENIHRLRHAHLALMSWWANSKEPIIIDIPQNNSKAPINLEVYLSTLLYKDLKTYGLNPILNDPWLSSSMVFGFVEVLLNNKWSFLNFIHWIFISENKLSDRFLEEGILATLILICPDIFSLESLSEKEKTLLYNLLFESILDKGYYTFQKDSIPYTINFISSYIKHTSQEEDFYTEILLKIKERILGAYLNTDQVIFLTFLLAKILEKLPIKSIDYQTLAILENNKILCLVDRWNFEKDEKKKNQFYYDVLIKNIERIKNSAASPVTIQYVIPNAIDELKNENITPVLYQALENIGINNKECYPLLRGIKEIFHERRIYLEKKIERMMKKIDKNKDLNTFKAFIKEYKIEMNLQINYAIRFTKNYLPIEEQFFKNLAVMMIEPLQSILVYFESINYQYIKMQESLEYAETKIPKKVKERHFKEIFRQIYRILSFNPIGKIFLKMKDFCADKDLLQILQNYENLSYYYSRKSTYQKDFFDLKNLLQDLDSFADYLPDSLLIYPFLPILIKRTYEPFEALKKIMMEKKWVNFLIEKKILHVLSDDVFNTEYTKMKIEVENKTLQIQGMIEEWTYNRAMLNENIVMDLKERIALIQKNNLLLSNMLEELREFLPTPVYYIHTKVVKDEEYKSKKELEKVKIIYDKDEKKMMDIVEEMPSHELKKDYKNFTNTEKLQLLYFCLIFNYANNCFQKPMAKKLKGLQKKFQPYLIYHNFNPNIQIKWIGMIGIIIGLLLSIMFGYLASFITGGSEQLWSFYYNLHWVSAITLGFVMLIACYKKVADIINKKLVNLEKNKIYHNYTENKRKRSLLIQGIILAILLSLFGLIIYHPPIAFLDEKKKKEYSLLSIPKALENQMLVNLVKKLGDEDKQEFLKYYSLEKENKKFLREDIGDIEINKIETIININPVQLIFEQIAFYVKNFWQTILRYLISFPLTALFVGLYLENKLEDKS